MWSLQRILYERKTQRFVDNMIHKYSNIRLSENTKAIARKRRRIEATGAREHKIKQGPYYGNHGERSTSSCCQTESARSLRLSVKVFGFEQSQLEKRHKQQQPHQDETHFYHWRMSETLTESEYGSGMSTSRLIRLVEEEEDDNNTCLLASPRTPAFDSVVATSQAVDTNERGYSNSSSVCIELTTTCMTNQLELSGCPSVSLSVAEESGSTSSSSSPTISTTEALLPRLRPTAPVHCVVPNCCDFFTSPHPHYPKEVIGMAKSDESLHSIPIPTNSTTTSAATIITQGTENERGSDQERGAEYANDSNVAQNSDEFEMWDYVCPQYARRNCANEWV
ncbi:unnamed protein product [Peronospora belbahrii]|uniref:Uncharacterized protein n=1 Tax=Peronospora belbahrii TaxID=622444 RepID=A0AAU9LQW4_9STRA|nr:unnamed protein product [Peronospora belbahrii]CAH0518112.1 unnamed protein product [Peronospora belbahrii]